MKHSRPTFDAEKMTQQHINRNDDQKTTVEEKNSNYSGNVMEIVAP